MDNTNLVLIYNIVLRKYKVDMLLNLIFIFLEKILY